MSRSFSFFFFQAEDGIRDVAVTGVQTCALPISHFSGGGMRDAGSVAAGEPTHLASRISHPADVQTLQALLDLSGPGGYVLLLGSAAQHAVGLAGLMGGIHFEIGRAHV